VGAALIYLRNAHTAKGITGYRHPMNNKLLPLFLFLAALGFTTGTFLDRLWVVLVVLAAGIHYTLEAIKQ